MSFDSKSPLSFELPDQWKPEQWRQEVPQRFLVARRRLEDWMKQLADAAEEDIPVEWETIEWIGGPFDGLQRRVERWKVPNLPAHLEIPVHPAAFDCIEGRDEGCSEGDLNELGGSAPVAIYLSAVRGTCFRYQFAGTRPSH